MIKVIVEELLNVESLDATGNNYETINEEKLLQSTKTVTVTSTDNNIELKACVVFMDRLDDQLYEHYLEKFEKSRVYFDEELLVEEKYSNLDKTSKMEVDDEEGNDVDEELFLCEICFESLNTRKELQQHYKDKHITNIDSNNQTVTNELGESGSNVKKQFKSSDDEKKIKKKPKTEDVKPIQPVIPPEEK